MEFPFTIPRANGSAFTSSINVGNVLIFVGANGSGKSSLVQSIFSSHSANARRISAHRQNWLQEGDGGMTPTARAQLDKDLRIWDRDPTARHVDHGGQARPTAALFDLVEAHNRQEREVAKLARAQNQEELKKRISEPSPIEVMNSLFHLCGMSVSLELEHSGVLMARRQGGPPYPVSMLSDGERSALLTASTVLTVRPGFLILIDEPERHLHRSISAPLLKLLVERRPDCAFVISTHEVQLPSDLPGSRTILVRNCQLVGNIPQTWDVDELEPNADIDEVLKIDILGARRSVIFVEGDNRSLDRPFYSLLFPEVSVIAKRTCKEVEHAVEGVRGAKELHWVHAFGIVDNDRRTTADVVALKAKGVYALPLLNVESIYYHSEIQRRATARQAEVDGGDPTARLASAKAKALAAIRPHKDRLCNLAVMSVARVKIFASLPDMNAIKQRSNIAISVDVGNIAAAEEKKLADLLAGDQLDSITSSYDVRSTPALSAIADALGFKGRSQYEAAVRKLLETDATAVDFVRTTFFAELWADLPRQ